jgi:uncharacterized protein GlcG (DUF336 family)
VTLVRATTLITAAEGKAHEMGHPFVIAVVDESGVLKAFSRMDGAALLAVQVAQDKAYTAIGFGGHYTQDMDVAKAGLSALGD